jgi:hypothetical protein
MEILEFIFQSFWYFLGTLILIGSVCNGIGRIGQKHYHYYYEGNEWKRQ